jgi:hypothetical protein
MFAGSVNHKSIRVEQVHRLAGIEPELCNTREQPTLSIFVNIQHAAAGIFDFDTPRIFHKPVPLADDSADVV